MRKVPFSPSGIHCLKEFFGCKQGLKTFEVVAERKKVGLCRDLAKSFHHEMGTVHIPFYGPERMLLKTFALFQFCPIRIKPENYFPAFLLQRLPLLALRHIGYFLFFAISLKSAFFIRQFLEKSSSYHFLVLHSV